MERVVVVLSLLLVSFSAILPFESAHAEDQKAYWMCKNHKEVRTIRVRVDGKGQCATVYSKQGVEKTVGAGKNNESCMGFLKSIKTNLEKSNWNCRDISDTQITSLE